MFVGGIPMNLAGSVIDILLLCIIILIVISAYRKGFLRSAILTIGYFVSILASILFSRILSNYIYQSIIRQKIITSVNATLSENINNIDITKVFSEFLSKLPSFLSNSMYSYFGGKDAVINQVQGITGNTTQNISVVIADQIIQPIVTLLLNALLCLALFFVCYFIVKQVAKLFKGFYAIPIIGPINSFLGGVLGVLQAFIVVIIITIVLRFIITLSGDTLSWLNSSIIDSTFLFKYFYDLKFI